MSPLRPTHTATRNRILSALTPRPYEHLSPHLEPVNLWQGVSLCRPEEPITHIYFPDRGTVSLVPVFEDGRSVEVGMAGDEGMLGVCVFLGSVSTPTGARVHLDDVGRAAGWHQRGGRST